MTRISIRALARFQAAFGLNPRSYFLPEDPGPDVPSYEPTALLKTDDSPGVNPLGHPLFDQLTILAGRTPATTENAGIEYEEYRFSVDPVIQVTRPKRIVRTAIPGSTGSVKELIGADDYQIRIRGIIASTDGGFPADEVQRLINMLELNASLEVSSKLLNYYGISRMVITRYDMPRSPGFPDQQAFDIRAVSDVADEIYFEEFVR